MLGITEIIVLCYKIPTSSIYSTVTIQLAYQLYKRNKRYLHEYYSILVVEGTVSNLYFLTETFFLMLPKWGVWIDVFYQYNWVSRIGNFFSATMNCTLFELALLVSFNRFVALFYPHSYSSKE
uniref:7TM_GPCR_Srx domain-containing protein n=1 Tax=Rhabditophanes sp. KR3021 TaxID=114890 RepID=A0AC35TXH0_9BILA